MYTIEVTARFEKDFLKLDESTQKLILEKLNLLKEKPYSAKRLHGTLRGHHSLRCGDYRVIFSVEEKRNTVILEHCGHRRRIYERRKRK